jgi:hypothetical protein
VALVSSGSALLIHSAGWDGRGQAVDQLDFPPFGVFLDVGLAGQVRGFDEPVVEGAEQHGPV